MSLTLIETPARELPTTVLSRWVAVHNPVMFRFQFASDVAYNASSYSIVGGQLVIQLDTNIGTALQIGDFIRITDGIDFYYPSITKVEDIGSPIVTKLTTNFTQNFGFTNVVDKWFENDYFVSVLVNVEGEFIAQAEYYPFKDGRINADVSEFLRTQLKAIEEYNFNDENQKDTNLSKQFKLVYTEYYRGNYRTCEESDVFHATNAANQILDEYDSNRGEYVPSILPVSPEQVIKGKWLTKFDKPIVYDGYPFSLSFILPQDIGSPELTIGAGSPITLDESQRGYINRISIDPVDITSTTTGDCVTVEGESLIGDCVKITEGDDTKLLEGTGDKLLEDCADIASLPNIPNAITNQAGGLCDLNLPLDVDFIVVYDTTSFSVTQSETFKQDYIDRYIDELRELYPKWSGSVNQYSIGNSAITINGVTDLGVAGLGATNERWVTWANIPANTGQKKVIMINLIDESNNAYITDISSNPATFTNQPTATYTSDYNNFIDNIYPNFDYFKAIVYSVPAGSAGNAFYANQQMHVYAAVEGTTVPVADFIPSQQGDITLIQSQNPYNSLGLGLKAYNFREIHDFASGISDIVYEDFRNDMDNFVFNS